LFVSFPFEGVTPGIALLPLNVSPLSPPYVLFFNRSCSAVFQRLATPRPRPSRLHFFSAILVENPLSGCFFPFPLAFLGYVQLSFLFLGVTASRPPQFSPLLPFFFPAIWFGLKNNQKVFLLFLQCWCSSALILSFSLFGPPSALPRLTFPPFADTFNLDTFQAPFPFPLQSQNDPCPPPYSAKIACPLDQSPPVFYYPVPPRTPHFRKGVSYVGGRPVT